MRPEPAHRLPGLSLALAVGALASGVAVYLVGRAGSQPWPGQGWWPSAAHCFAFALLSAACLPRTRPWAWGACGFWALVNLCFEAGQHPGWRPALLDALRHQPWLAAYFQRGIFDVADLAATAAGAAAAAWWLNHTLKRSVHEPT